MSCANASATKPFGTIDTPDQGGVASGSSFVNFGWALTPQPKLIPLDGSTISVLVDGARLGTVDYNHERADIEALFPGFQNTAGPNGAIGFRVIDTTTLTNGLHTISWTVDRQPGCDRGARQPVLHGVEWGGGAADRGGPSGPRTVSRRRRARDRRRTAGRGALLGRRGWDLDGAAARVRVGGDGPDDRPQRGSEPRRAAAWRPGGTTRATCARATGFAALPSRSQLDPTTGALHLGAGRGLHRRVRPGVRPAVRRRTRSRAGRCGCSCSRRAADSSARRS